MKTTRFSLWRQQTLWSQCQERVHKFCKLYVHPVQPINQYQPAIYHQLTVYPALW